MEIVATTCNFGVDEDDVPFSYVLFRDDKSDFTFSLTRILGEDDDGLIEFMVIDQILENIQDCELNLCEKYIVVSVPEGLQEHTNGDSELKINHTLNNSQTKGLIKHIKLIFAGKSGLQICI